MLPWRCARQLEVILIHPDVRLLPQVAQFRLDLLLAQAGLNRGLNFFYIRLDMFQHLDKYDALRSVDGLA